NKSHAAAYALVSYHTAYMKAHYPVEFIAASMTLDLNNTDKLSEFRAEAQRLGIKVEAPNINRSGATFEVGENTIYYALAALKGQNDRFGNAADAPTIMLPQIEPWLPAERLRREYDAIGFFLSGHPLDDYATVLKRLRVQSWAEFSRAVKTGATAGKVAATVVSRMERRTKTGNKMGIMGLSDPTGHFEAVLFSEGLAQYRDVLEPGAAVLLQL